jgi:hypothetical protein
MRALKALLLCAVLPANAATLDQSFWPAEADYVATVGPILYGSTYQTYQSFTAGMDGRLSGLDISLGKEGDPLTGVTLEIFAGTDPLGSALAWAWIPASDIPVKGNEPPLVTVDFKDFQVTAGDVYGFRLSSSLVAFGTYTPRFWAYFSELGGYDGGSGRHIVNGGADPFAFGSWDFYFRTYVSTVPEPGTFILLALGLLGIRASTSPRR